MCAFAALYLCAIMLCVDNPGDGETAIKCNPMITLDPVVGYPLIVIAVQCMGRDYCGKII